MITAVDTNAILALLYDDGHADASERELRAAYRDGRVVITPVVYAELSADGHFETVDELAAVLSDFSIGVTEPSREALFVAGEQFRAYTRRRPDGLQCPSCGTERSATCPDCGADLSPHQHVAADFLIGGHATADADRLVTFDSGFYGTYFPSVPVRPE